MAKFRYLTPDAAAGSYTCRRLSIPVELVSHVTAALWELCKDYHWEALGTMTTDEARELCYAMFIGYLESDCMIGKVDCYAGALPGNVLLCDGASYQRVDYPELYSVLDSSFITDADNFVVPDLRGRSPIGAGSGPGLTTRAVGDTGGEESHQLSEGEMPSHTHTSHYHVLDFDVESLEPGLPQTVSGPWGATTTGATGGDGAHNNMQPFVALKWGIVAR